MATDTLLPDSSVVQILAVFLEHEQGGQGCLLSRTAERIGAVFQCRYGLVGGDLLGID